MEDMTLHRLEQYRDQRREIGQLRRDITLLEQQRPPVMTDTVKGSDPEWPYVEHTVTVKGISTKAIRRRERLLEIYRTRAGRLEQDLVQVELWVDGLQDSKLRQIVRLHYLQGKSWRATAHQVYGSALSEDAARKRVARFFEEIL